MFLKIAEMSEQLRRSRQIASILLGLMKLVIPVIVVVAIAVPVVLLILKLLKTKKNIVGKKFDQDGNFELSDINLRNNFLSVKKVDNYLVFVANEFTKKAGLSIVNVSMKKRTTFVKLDFSKGNTVSVPVQEGTNEIAIIVESVNGKKCINDISFDCSLGSTLVSSFVPSVGITLSCLYLDIMMLCALNSDMISDMIARNNIAPIFILTFLPLVLGIPGIFFLMMLFNDSLNK